jgi:hypothetical protein
MNARVKAADYVRILVNAYGARVQANVFTAKILVFARIAGVLKSATIVVVLVERWRSI